MLNELVVAVLSLSLFSPSSSSSTHFETMSCQICNRLDAQPSRQREDLEMRLVAQFRKRSQRVFRIQLTLSISLTLLLSLTLSALTATLSVEAA